MFVGGWSTDISSLANISITPSRANGSGVASSSSAELQQQAISQQRRPSGQTPQTRQGPPRSIGSQRPHYAVEKKYRSTLNDKYAALARALSSQSIQRICRSKSPSWSFDADNTASSSSQTEVTGGTTKSRQRKTTTLSMIIETIHILDECCRQEARELDQLRSGLGAVRSTARQLLGRSSWEAGPGRAS